jgi:predicted transcriptional regulator
MEQSKENTPSSHTTPNLIKLASGIVSAYVSNNSVTTAELPKLINQVLEALERVATGGAAGQGGQKPKPVVAIKDSITPEYIICLDDGKRLKLLKRHLRTVYNMTPDEYRTKWGLPYDYPMVAPNYAESRSVLAKKIGLGRQPVRRAHN